jgi:hypothetical protein
MMRSKTMLVVLLAALSAVLQANAKESLADYVASCKQELGFESIPQFDCRSVKFRTSSDEEVDYGLFKDDRNFFRSNDFVAHRRINDSVDAVFACRWVANDTGDSGADSAEMIVHNRRNGKTCFFELNPINDRPDLSPIVGTTNPPSPTHRDANKVWKAPPDYKNCATCHSAGPYIASPEIVDALSKFGLMNDGHDIQGKIYSAVGQTFGKKFNDEMKSSRQPAKLPNGSVNYRAACASACHIVGGYFPNESIAAGVRGATGNDSNFSSEIIIPSINLVLEDVENVGHMPPSDPYSDYRWLNRDDPGGTGDYERVSDFVLDKEEGKPVIPEFYCDGKTPANIQVHRVDSSTIFTPSQFTYRKLFNLQDGLVCKNADFDKNHPYKCFDHETRYKCDGEWTAWKSHTRNTVGDDESRSRYKKSWGLCDNPTDMQARYKAPDGSGYVNPITGPRDRFRQFDNKGLLCKNEDQDDSKCSNYVVRFICD